MNWDKKTSMSGAINAETASTTAAEWANSAKTGSRCSLKIFDTPSSGCATSTPALLLSGITLTPSDAASAGSRTTSVTRASMASHTDAGANPAIRKNPRSSHDARCSSLTTAPPSTALIAAAPPAPAAGHRPGRGQASGVTSLAITRAQRDPRPLDRGMREAALAPGRAVGEVDDRVHPTDGTGGVGPRQVEGQAVVERHRAGRHLDEHRLDPGQLPPRQRVVTVAVA